MAVRPCTVPYGTFVGYSPWHAKTLVVFGLSGLTWFVVFVDDKPLLYAGLPA